MNEPVTFLNTIMNTVQCRWDNCNLKFASDRHCLNHIRKDHDLRLTHGRCLWDGCSFYSNTLIVRNHVKKHFNLIEAVCTICKENKQFKWRFDMNKHLKQFHNDEAVIATMNVDGFDIRIASPPGSNVIPKSLSNILN